VTHAQGQPKRRRLDDARREELLDGVLEIISARGFSGVRTAELARELHCSESTLYKIAPSKDSLVVLAIARWGENVLAEFEERASKGATAGERARLYFRAGAESLRSWSHAFRSDVDRFESTRAAYRAVSERFIDRFVQLLDAAVVAGEIGAVNTRFLASAFRAMALVIRDERILAASDLTAEKAILEIDGLIWDGLARR
jgi:AcrR family transcriptional regulator